MIERPRRRDLFEALEGASLDGRLSGKTPIVAAALGGDPGEGAWMVGDRRHDVEAALDLGLTPAGALWGYGGRDELEAAGAAWLVERPTSTCSTGPPPRERR